MTLKIDRPGRGLAGVAWRLLWQTVGGLVIFAQIAVAADQCLPNLFPGGHQGHAGVVAGSAHDLDSHCVSDLLPADQAPPPEAKRPSPHIGVMPAPAAWRSTPDPGLTWVSHPPARAGPSLRLRFRNLRL